MSEAALLPGIPRPIRVDDLVRELLSTNLHHDEPQMLRAHRELARAVAHGHEAVASGAFSAWIRLWREGVHSAFLVDPADLASYQRLARAGLRLDRHLTGTDQRTAGPAVAVGEHLAVTATVQLGSTVLERSAVLEVTEVDTSRRFVRLTAPADGINERLTLADPAWRRVEHAYAELATPRHSRTIADGLSW